MIEHIWCKLIKKLRGRSIRNSSIAKSSKIEAGSVILNSNMEKYSFCGYDCKILNADIGSFCSIADGVVIGGAEHPISWVSTSPVFYAGRDSVKKKFSTYEREKAERTIVGSDVWIGDRAIIKGGVTIGNGAVIGMGAVVCHDVKPYEIVGGVPAHHIRYRFETDVIDKLLLTKWWEMDEVRLVKAAKHIKNPKLFIEEVTK